MQILLHYYGNATIYFKVGRVVTTYIEKEIQWCLIIINMIIVCHFIIHSYRTKQVIAPHNVMIYKEIRFLLRLGFWLLGENNFIQKLNWF